MKFTGFTEPEPGGWDALHQGTEREGIDQPGRIELSRISTIMPRRPVVPAEPVPTTPIPAAEPPASGPVYLASSGSRVRPYTRTGGRTRTAHELALEALVSTSDDGKRYRGVRTVEHRQICDLCLDTRSIAEIAAHLRLPLGVVKVLVGDMADAGLVVIHQTELILGDQSSRAFMERVLQGLRAL
jgi:hypothetical protein